MRYLIAVIDTATGTGTSAEMSAIDAFNDQLMADGHWVLACGIGAPGTSVVIDGRGDRPVFNEGPLHDLPEYMSGFWIVDVPDDDTARRLAAEGSRCCNRKVELRPFL